MRLVGIASMLLTTGLAASAIAQAPLPLSVHLTYSTMDPAVQVEGSALPGTVVQLRGKTAIVDDSGSFDLASRFPIHLVAVRDKHIRRLRLDLPEEARRWLTRLEITTDLTRMKALVSGRLTIVEHPPATAVVRHMQAGTAHRTAVTRGTFRLEFPLVTHTYTLEWTLHLSFLAYPGPSPSFDVQ